MSANQANTVRQDPGGLEPSIWRWPAKGHKSGEVLV